MNSKMEEAVYSAVQMQRPVSDSPVRQQSQVNLALSDLDIQIDKLDSILSELESKISPVLRPFGPCCDETAAEDDSVPLAAQISKYSRSARCLYNRVADLVNRIEL